MRLKKPKFWNSINFLSICLWPLSLITVIFNILKTHIITGFRFNIPVICVGNVFIGGTGKTPLSIYIYNLLKKRRFKPQRMQSTSARPRAQATALHSLGQYLHLVNFKELSLENQLSLNFNIL